MPANNVSFPVLSHKTYTPPPAESAASQSAASKAGWAKRVHINIPFQGLLSGKKQQAPILPVHVSDVERGVENIQMGSTTQTQARVQAQRQTQRQAQQRKQTQRQAEARTQEARAQEGDLKITAAPLENIPERVHAQEDDLGVTVSTGVIGEGGPEEETVVNMIDQKLTELLEQYNQAKKPDIDPLHVIAFLQEREVQNGLEPPKGWVRETFTDFGNWLTSKEGTEKQDWGRVDDRYHDIFELDEVDRKRADRSYLVSGAFYGGGTLLSTVASMIPPAVTLGMYYQNREYYDDHRFEVAVAGAAMQTVISLFLNGMLNTVSQLGVVAMQELVRTVYSARCPEMTKSGTYETLEKEFKENEKELKRVEDQLEVYDARLQSEDVSDEEKVAILNDVGNLMLEAASLEEKKEELEFRRETRRDVIDLNYTGQATQRYSKLLKTAGTFACYIAGFLKKSVAISQWGQIGFGSLSILTNIGTAMIDDYRKMKATRIATQKATNPIRPESRHKAVADLEPADIDTSVLQSQMKFQIEEAVESVDEIVSSDLTMAEQAVTDILGKNGMEMTVEEFKSTYYPMRDTLETEGRFAALPPDQLRLHAKLEELNIENIEIVGQLHDDQAKLKAGNWTALSPQVKSLLLTATDPSLWERAKAAALTGWARARNPKDMLAQMSQRYGSPSPYFFFGNNPQLVLGSVFRVADSLMDTNPADDIYTGIPILWKAGVLGVQAAATGVTYWFSGANVNQKITKRNELNAIAKEGKSLQRVGVWQWGNFGQGLKAVFEAMDATGKAYRQYRGVSGASAACDKAATKLEQARAKLQATIDGLPEELRALMNSTDEDAPLDKGKTQDENVVEELINKPMSSAQAAELAKNLVEAQEAEEELRKAMEEQEAKPEL